MAVTEAQYKAQRKYDKEHIKTFMMRLHRTNDADILNWLDEQTNKQGTIKELIRREIKRNEEKGQ